MNGNTYFNFRFYNPLPVQRQQVAAANLEALSLRESLGVRAAYISWVVRGCSPPILRTWVQKSPLLLQNRGHAEVLKKTPSSAKYVTRVRPLSVPECPPPPPSPPPGFLYIIGDTVRSDRFHKKGAAALSS